MHLGLDIATTCMTWSAAESKAVKQVLEDAPLVAEQVADVADVHPHPAPVRSEPDTTTSACERTELVVLAPPLGVREDRMSLGDLLEAHLGRGITFVGVRMELLRQFAVRLLDLIFR